MTTVGDLKRGQRFRCGGGKSWTYQRRHQVNPGVRLATGEDGRTGYFSESAAAEPLPPEFDRWVIYYGSDYAVSYSVAPCRVVHRGKHHWRVELSCGRREWVLPSQVFATATDAHTAALAARGVNAY